jgi:hypothetical protein
MAAGVRAADAIIDYGAHWLSPEVQPVLQLDGLRLVGTGLLRKKLSLLLIRIFGGELGVLRTQSQNESLAFHFGVS